MDVEPSPTLSWDAGKHRALSKRRLKPANSLSSATYRRNPSGVRADGPSTKSVAG